MSAYRKPTKLIPLILYSPNDLGSTHRTLISRDRKRISSLFNGTQELDRTVQSPFEICVKSFNWMYKTNVCRTSSYHLEQSIGKIRRHRLEPVGKRQSLREEGPKKYVTRKPTVVLRKSLLLESFQTMLVEKVDKGSVILTSACLEYKGKNIYVPLEQLKNIIFAPEGEVIFNVTACMANGDWTLAENLYSNYEEISSDYIASYFLPNIELAVVHIKSKTLFSRGVGKLIMKFEAKGLVLKYCRMIELAGAVIVMAWLGCEAISVSRKILEKLNSDFYEITTWEKTKGLLPRKGRKLTTDILPKITLRINGEYSSFTYPYIKYSENDSVMPVPLGVLKEMILAGFSGWSEIWTKKNQEDFPHRRGGFESSCLKASVKVKDEPCILSLNSYEIQISNSELEASFGFKVRELELVLNHLGSDLITHLMKTAKLVLKESRGKTFWDLVVDVESILPSKGEVPKESRVVINEKEFKCKFFHPSFELYRPHSEEVVVLTVKTEDLREICRSQFKGWEGIALKYFN